MLDFHNCLIYFKMPEIKENGGLIVDIINSHNCGTHHETRGPEHMEYLLS